MQLLRYLARVDVLIPYSRSLVVVAVMLAVGALPTVALAAPTKDLGVPCKEISEGVKCVETSEATPQKFVEIILDILDAFLVLVGVIALGALIWGGVKYMLTLGEPEEATKAKRIIVYAIIGLVVVGLAALIVNFVLGTFKQAP